MAPFIIKSVYFLGVIVSPPPSPHPPIQDLFANGIFIFL